MFEKPYIKTNRVLFHKKVCKKYKGLVRITSFILSETLFAKHLVSSYMKLQNIHALMD